MKEVIIMDKNKIINVLKRIYDESYQTDEYSELITLLEGIKINSLVNYYINYHDEYDEDDLSIIEFIIRILQNIYNNATDCVSPISDEDFDILHEILLSGTNKNIVGGKNVKNKKIVNHRYPDLRGTLLKAHFLTNEEKGKDKRRSVEDWLNSITNILGRPLRGDELTINLFPKFDGVSVIFECNKDGTVQRALTRGDTESNEAVDITPLFSMLKFEPYEKWDSEFAIKTEVVITLPNFKLLCDKYTKFKNPRAAASSIINRDPDPKFLKYLTIVPLRMQNFDTKEIIIHSDAFEIYPAVTFDLTDYKKMMSVMDYLKDYVKTFLEMPTDGVVIHMTSKYIQTTIGRENAINKYELAYKFKPESVKTILLDVEFCIGLLGSVTPVAKVEPVKMNGNTIQNISLGSIDRFESLHLRKGDEVIIKYEIIPYLDVDDTCESSKNSLIPVPTHCMYCDEKLIKDPTLRCVNPECPSQIIGKIVNYTDKMNIPDISIGIITTLFNKGYLKSIQDLYRLKDKKKDIVKIEGFGSKSVDNILKGIKSRNKVFDYILLGSIGIPSIGRKIFKKILNIYYIDELIDICINSDVKKLTNVYGIKEKTANKIIVGIVSNLELIQFLRKELRVERDNKRYTMRVLFTKVRPDKDFEKFLDDKEIEILSGYKKNVDLVITDNINSESSKLDKARKDGKEIITMEEAYKVFGYQRS